MIDSPVSKCLGIISYTPNTYGAYVCGACSTADWFYGQGRIHASIYRMMRDSVSAG